MGKGIALIICGLILLLVPKTQMYKDYVEKHNFTETEDFLNYIRTMSGAIIIIIGIMMGVIEALKT